MNGRFDLAPIGRRISTSRCGVISAMNLDHFALLILHYIRAGDEVAIPQPDLAPWRQAVILLGRNLRKSSCSMYSTRENGTFRVPAVGSSGLFTASISST